MEQLPHCSLEISRSTALPRIFFDFDFDFISIPLSRKRDAHQPLKQGYLIGCFENKLYLFTKHIISLITGFKKNSS
jgi:hypothetical protein